MQIDKQSFNDISIFHPEEEFSIFHKLNFTRTLGGKEWLRKFFSEPHDDLKKIIGTQKVIRTLMERSALYRRPLATRKRSWGGWGEKMRTDSVSKTPALTSLW